MKAGAHRWFFTEMAIAVVATVVTGFARRTISSRSSRRPRCPLSIHIPSKQLQSLQQLLSILRTGFELALWDRALHHCEHRFWTEGNVRDRVLPTKNGPFKNIEDVRDTRASTSVFKRVLARWPSTRCGLGVGCAGQ